MAIDEPNNLARRLLGRERVDMQVKGPQQDVMAGAPRSGGRSYRRALQHRARRHTAVPSRIRIGRRNTRRPSPQGRGSGLGTSRSRGRYHVPRRDFPEVDHRGRPRRVGQRRERSVNTFHIAWKETKAYFGTPAAYIVGAMFLGLTGVFFVSDVTSAFAEASVRGIVDWASFFIIFLAPLLTMRLLAEEQKLGTLELLLTSPVRDWEVVLGKYLASLLALTAILSVTLYYALLLYAFGDPDTLPVVSGYLGAAAVRRGCAGDWDARIIAVRQPDSRRRSRHRHTADALIRQPDSEHRNRHSRRGVQRNVHERAHTGFQPGGNRHVQRRLLPVADRGVPVLDDKITGNAQVEIVG